MENIKVYSTIEDKNIRKNLKDSPIWKKAIHSDDLRNVENSLDVIWEYDIKFDGLTPIQVTKVNRYK